MSDNKDEALLARVIAFLERHGGPYCPDCIRTRLSLGRATSTMALLRVVASAQDDRIVQQRGTCLCCRRSREVLQADRRAAGATGRPVE